MRDGDIVEQGINEELLADGGFYAELHNSQFEQFILKSYHFHTGRNSNVIYPQLRSHELRKRFLFHLLIC
jgi:hypothetical protein